MNSRFRHFGLIFIVLIARALLIDCGTLRAQETEPIQDITENVGETIKQVGENEITIGLQMSYLGTFDSVSAVNGKSGSNSNKVISVDGEPEGSYFIELKGSKKEAGFQNLRYENSILNPNTDLDKVNPLNARGSTSESLESKKESFQIFSTELAPIQGVPNLIVQLREEHLISKVKLKADIDASYLPLTYVPYENNGTPITLTPGATYYFETKLEEVIAAYYLRPFDVPVKIAWFDMVYLKPILIESSNPTVNVDIYMPKFSAHGYLVEIQNIPFTPFSGFNVLVDLGFRVSQSGKMTLRENLSEEEKAYLDNESDISMDGGHIKLDFDWKGSFKVVFRSQFLAITQKSNLEGGSELISLDAINTFAVAWTF